MSTKRVIWKVLVIVDHFSRYIQAYKTEDKSALSTAKCLYDNYFPCCRCRKNGTINGFGLDLASFTLRDVDPEPETGPVALAMPMETLLNARDGQRIDSDDENNSLTKP